MGPVKRLVIRIWVHMRRIACAPHPPTEAAIFLAHLNPKQSLKVPCSAPRGDLDAPSASSLSSREANSDDNKIQIHVERVQYVLPPTEGAVFFLAHLNPKQSLKVPCSAPRGDLDSPFGLLSLPSREAHRDNSKKRIPPPILIDQQRDFPFKKTAATYSPTFSSAVPSALRGLTSLFGMGRGGSPVL